MDKHSNGSKPQFKIELDIKNLDWQELAELYRRAPLGDRKPEDLEAAFKASYLVAIARYESQIVGAGRIISDAIYYANIYDFAVKPEFQCKGIGTRIMSTLISEIPHLFKLLTATTGREEFYRKFGFRRHKTAMAIYPPGKEANAKLYLDIQED